MAKSAKAFVFFNCDEGKSEASMNIFYNHAVYKDSKTSRKSLLKKVKEEIDLKRVQVDEGNLEKLENLILEGDPVEAGNLIRFGAIKALDCF